MPDNLQTASQSRVGLTDLLAWLDDQLNVATRAVAAREQSAQTWASGSSVEWRKAGCRMTKAERLKEAEKERRILVKCRRDVAAIESLIAIVCKLPR